MARDLGFAGLIVMIVASRDGKVQSLEEKGGKGKGDKNNIWRRAKSNRIKIEFGRLEREDERRGEKEKEKRTRKVLS